MKEQIKIGGQKRDIAFNYAAIKTYETTTGEGYLTAIEGIAAGKLTAIIGVAHAGLAGAGGHHDIDTVAEWVTKMDEKELTQLMRIFFDSFPKPESNATEVALEEATPPEGLGE